MSKKKKSVSCVTMLGSGVIKEMTPPLKVKWSPPLHSWTLFTQWRSNMYISDTDRNISINCSLNALFSFYLFMVYIPECKQQQRTMK